MKTSQLFIASAVAAALTLPIASLAQAGPAPKPKFDAEKCYGIARAGKNDCQTANSSCAGTSKRDAQNDAWIYVPAGTCDPWSTAAPSRRRPEQDGGGDRDPIMSARPETLPTRAGVGLRAPHVAEVLATRPAAAWLEVHAENYMGGGPAVAALERIRSAYPLTLHGVGLSLGSATGLDRRHLGRLRAVVDRFQPTLLSEHLSWSTAGGAYLNHLLPMPYTEEALEVLARNIGEAQDALGRRLLIENPSAYLRFADSTICEPELLGELARRTGCALLCDVNNVYVSATNLGESPSAWLDAFPADAVEEMHLAGHARNDADGQVVLIDDHGSPVTDAVWALYAHALTRFGPVPTLIEWDTNMPALAELLAEAAKADRLLEARRARAA